MSELNHYHPNYINNKFKSKDCSMNVIAYKNNHHQNGFKNYNNDESNLQSYHPQTLMHRSATQNHLSSNSTKQDTNSLYNWPNKSNWLSASGRLGSMSFYSMLSNSLSNLSISAFNYKLEFGKLYFYYSLFLVFI